MFLKHLSAGQHLAFLSLAVELIASDAVTTVGEMSGLAGVRGELGLDWAGEDEMLPVATAAARMNDGPSRRVSLLELMMLAGADGRLSIHESNLLERLCGLWRMDPAQLEAMRSWVGRYRDLKAEARAMIFEEK